MIQTEALIIGAGPVGLFQAFQLGLQDIRCHVVDALPQVGGQCAELYADKPIYDIPGIPLCTGQELIDQLQKQIKPFSPQFHLQELVSELKATEDGQWHVQTDKGKQFKAATVFIAAGVGAFVQRGLSLHHHLELRLWLGPPQSALILRCKLRAFVQWLEALLEIDRACEPG